MNNLKKLKKYIMVLIDYVLVLASASSEYSCFAVTFRKSLQTFVSVHLNLSLDMYRRERSSFGYPVCPGLLLTKFPISKTDSFPSTLFLRIYLQNSMGPVLVDLQGWHTPICSPKLFVRSRLVKRSRLWLQLHCCAQEDVRGEEKGYLC